MEPQGTAFFPLRISVVCQIFFSIIFVLVAHVQIQKRFCLHHAAKSIHEPKIATKTVFLSFPSSSKVDEHVTKTLTFCGREDFNRYLDDEHVGFLNPDTNEVFYSYDLLVSGRHYFASGRRIDDERRHQSTQAAAADILQRKAAVAVSRSMEAGAVIHSNVKFELNGKHHKYDAIVVRAHEVTKPFVAYIVENSHSVQPGDVAWLLQRVETFKAWAATSYRYKTVATFVPVLAGRCFPEETIRECIAHNVSRVARSGESYEWIRGDRDVNETGDLCAKKVQMGAEGSVLHEEEPTETSTVSSYPSRMCLRQYPVILYV